MRILHLALCGCVTDGFNYQENNLTKFNALDGHEVYLVASKWVYNNKGKMVYEDRSDYVYNNVHFIRLDIKGKNDFLRKLKRYNNLYETLEMINPDLILCHGVQFVDIKVLVKYLKKHKNVKMYADNHADFVNSATNFLSKNILHKVIWRHYSNMLIPYATKFFGVLPARVNFLNEVYKIPKDKIELLVMGADDELVQKARLEDKTPIKEKLGITQDDFVIVTGGKIDFKKNTHLLMDAVNQIDNKNLKLVIFGSVDESILDTFNSKLSDKVKYAGWMNSYESYVYFDMADLVVFPGGHSVYWEQTAGQGKPLMVKCWPGVNHIDYNGNVIYLKEDTSEEIKKNIEYLINNKDKYNDMKNAAEKASINFSYQEISRRYTK